MRPLIIKNVIRLQKTKAEIKKSNQLNKKNGVEADKITIYTLKF